MTPDEVHRHVCEAFDEFERRHLERIAPTNWASFLANLVNWVRGIDPATAFDGLLELLESERRYVYQNLAGELLKKSCIPCPLSLAEFLRRVLPLWDLSAGTVLAYAAHEFGREAVLVHVQELQAAKVSWPSRDALDGVRYHLSAIPRQQVEQRGDVQ